MGTCGPSIARPEESKVALTKLGATLNDRIMDLKQQSEELQETNRELKEQSDELQKEKTQLAKQVDKLEASLREKREQLWDTIQDFRDEMKEKKKELQEAENRQAEYRRMESLLREEVGSLQREIREQKESVSQATRVLKEKEQLATETQTRLQETVEQLERRLRTKDAEIGSLQQLIRDQKTSFSQATRRFNEKTGKATAKKARLKEKVAQLERRREVESKAFERERAQLAQVVAKYRNDAQMQKAISCQNDAQEKLNLLLDNAMPQLRSLLSAYDRLRGNQQGKSAQGKSGAAVTRLGRAADEDYLKRLKEQEQVFDQERAQLLEQASDAAKTQRDVVRQSLMEREGLLTCPISLELFEFPVLTGCCGKTFSAEALRQAVNQSPLCPFCRGQLASTNANRDMTKLVELHRRERSVLGIPAAEEATATSRVSHSDDYAVLSTTTETAPCSRRSNGSSSTRETRHKEHRSERVQARSEVPHRQSLRVFDPPGNASRNATSVAASNPSPTTAVSTTATDNSPDAQPSTSGLSIWRVGSDGPVAVPRDMVRSVLSTIRFPSAQSRSTASSRQRSRSSVHRSTASSRQRSRSRTTAATSGSSSATASPAVAQQQVRSSSTSRCRASNSSVVSSASSTALSTAVPSATPNSASLSRRRTSRSSPSVQNVSVTAESISAASIGARLAAMPLAASNGAQHSFISPAANGPQSSQPSSTSDTSNTAGDPSASMDAWMKAWIHDNPATGTSSTTTSTINQLSRPSARPTAVSTTAASSARSMASRSARAAASAVSASTTSAASRRPARISATQDSVLGCVKHESPRLTASQPTPRQSLSSLARSVTSLEDLLGSDFESISDSD